MRRPTSGPNLPAIEANNTAELIGLTIAISVVENRTTSRRCRTGMLVSRRDQARVVAGRVDVFGDARVADLDVLRRVVAEHGLGAGRGIRVSQRVEHGAREDHR